MALLLSVFVLQNLFLKYSISMRSTATVAYGSATNGSSFLTHQYMVRTGYIVYICRFACGYSEAGPGLSAPLRYRLSRIIEIIILTVNVLVHVPLESDVCFVG